MDNLTEDFGNFSTLQFMDDNSLIAELGIEPIQPVEDTMKLLDSNSSNFVSLMPPSPKPLTYNHLTQQQTTYYAIDTECQSLSHTVGLNDATLGSRDVTATTPFMLNPDPSAQQHISLALTENVHLDEDVQLTENVHLDENVQLTENVHLGENVQLTENVHLGDNVQFIKSPLIILQNFTSLERDCNNVETLSYYPNATSPADVAPGLDPGTPNQVLAIAHSPAVLIDPYISASSSIGHRPAAVPVPAVPIMPDSGASAADPISELGSISDPVTPPITNRGKCVKRCGPKQPHTSVTVNVEVPKAKSRRRRRPETTKKYQITEELADPNQERKRLNAINAKKNRDKTKNMLKTLEETVANVTLERDNLQKEVEELKMREQLLQDQLVHHLGSPLQVIYSRLEGAALSNNI